MAFGIELHYLPEDNSTSLDSIYTHDPCIISNNGIIICNMGKKARLAEYLFGFYTKYRYGIIDPLCGFKAYKTKNYRAIGLS